jgi:hypothetical protein
MTSEIQSNNFPHAVLTLLALELLQQEVSANAISVLSARGNSTLGHYALVVMPAKYVLAANIAFDHLQPPGAAPVHEIAPRSTICTQQQNQN